MSTLQVSNIHFESTGNNRIEYAGSNTVAFVAGGANVFVSNTTVVNFGEKQLVSGSAALDRRKNYIVNPGMRISQENGTSSGTASGYYPVDQFRMGHSQDGTLTSAQVASSTPGGSTHRIRLTVTSPDTSIGASQYASLKSLLEGLRVADLMWGTANAKDVVVRFGWKSPAGTYALVIRNQDNNRSFVREFTISGGDANTDTVQTLTIPGDTSGTWDSDNTASFDLTWTLAVGSTYQTTAGSWQAGNYLGTSSTSNGIGTGSDVFELFDVGLYADPDSTGIAPEFELPHYDDDLRACMRYYEKSLTGLYGTYDTTSASYTNWQYKVRKVATPSIAMGAGSSYTATNGVSADALIVYLTAGHCYIAPNTVANARM